MYKIYYFLISGGVIRVINALSPILDIDLNIKKMLEIYPLMNYDTYIFIIYYNCL